MNTHVHLCYRDSVLFEEEIVGRLEPITAEVENLESSVRAELRASHLRLSDIVAHLAEWSHLSFSLRSETFTLWLVELYIQE